ncbi:MAG: hypothetical protein PHI12_11085 [Dehalococcoidales bacterium]|nr:hypothetical protein [Candidatus Thermoplasmatota archaeon]MDD5511332.1 hypothetical protein [Dehalococcoidales bacterium]
MVTYYAEYKTESYIKLDDLEELEAVKAFRKWQGVTSLQFLICENDHGEICDLSDLQDDIISRGDYRW